MASTALRDAIRQEHGVESRVESVTVVERYNRELAWDGDVQVFELIGHAEAARPDLDREPRDRRHRGRAPDQRRSSHPGHRDLRMTAVCRTRLTFRRDLDRVGGFAHRENGL